MSRESRKRPQKKNSEKMSDEALDPISFFAVFCGYSSYAARLMLAAASIAGAA
jgi:hypothetical protein